MRNKITIDIMRERGYDCECIISEDDGKNTLELYMWNVYGDPSIEISWVDDSRYDVNGDGQITEEDAKEILEASLAGIQDSKYDVDGDGEVTAKDAAAVLRKLADDSQHEDSGSITVEGEFLRNGDYYYSFPIDLISGNREITLKVKTSDYESKPIYFNCINISEKTDFIVKRNLSHDDTYTVIATESDLLPIATTISTGVVQIGSGININGAGIISVPIASKEQLGIAKIGDGINVNQGTISLAPATIESLGVVQIGSGINVDENGKLCGDVDYESLEGIASKATPVPGGVGAVTTSVLLSHVVDAAKRAASLEQSPK